MSNGAARMLGTLGLAALAGGLAYGAHMIIPASDTGGESGSSPIAMSDDLCTLMDEMVAYTDALEASTTDSDLTLDESTGDDPAAIEAMHQQGQAMLDAIGPLTGYLSRAAELVTDPAVATAFETMARVAAAQMEYLGHMALDADSVGDYVAAMFGSMGDTEFVALIEENGVASAVAGDYIFETCGLDILSAGGLSNVEEVDIDTDVERDRGTEDSATESAVKLEVSVLGELMVDYYSDWEEGDPQAQFEVAGDNYELDGTTLSWVHEGIEITDQFANGPDDWCVEVTSAADPERPWTYSAQSGLAQGTCS